MERIINGLILASGQSKRLKNKNLLLINGKPLIQYTIDFVKKLNMFPMYIITDDNKIRQIAISNNINYIIIPKEINKVRNKTEVNLIFLPLIKTSLFSNRFLLSLALLPVKKNRRCVKAKRILPVPGKAKTSGFVMV